MNIRIYLIGLLALLTVFEQAWSAEPGFDLGLYVVVEDMAESKAFYQQLFDVEPYMDRGDFVAFSISGSLFSLFSKDAFDHPLVRGNGVVPYIRVNDIEREFERVKGLGANLVHEEILDEPPIKLFMFMDPSGNPIEFYSVEQ